MRGDFVFKFGKHAGKRYDWVEEHHPSYLVWAEENAPNLFKETIPKKAKPVEQKEVKFSDTKSTAMTPNENFYNEGPSEMSKPYLAMMGKLKEEITEVKSKNDNEWNF